MISFIDLLLYSFFLFFVGTADPVDAKVADMKQLLEINVLGPVLGAKFCVPALAASKGTFIIVSSVAGVMPRTATVLPLYSTTKSACDALVRQFSGLYAPKGVRVFGVNPVVYER